MKSTHFFGSALVLFPALLGAEGIIIDDGDTGHLATGGWVSQTVAGRFDGDWQYQSSAGGTETATYSFTALVSGRYVASRASWSQGNLSHSAVWTFSDNVGSFTQDQTFQVVDFDTDSGVAFQRFLDADSGRGKVLEILDGTLEVVLSDQDPAGFLIADALRLERLRPDVAEVFVIGDDSLGYAEIGGVWTSWGEDPGDHAEDVRLSEGTVEDEVEVTFNGLPSGDYRISVAWTGGVDRTNQASLAYSTGADSGSTTFDQVPGATADDFFDEVAWQDMFDSVTVSDGTLILTLGNVDASGILVADAFRLERLDVVGGFDLDGDGMPNVWEEQYGLNPNDSSDATLDGDNDGLSNVEEFSEGTFPNDDDSDDDGLSDGDEVNTIGTDPRDEDSDDDGLSDNEEAGEGGLGTNPLAADTDGDGQDDQQEVGAGTDPLTPNSEVVTDDGGVSYLVIDNGIQVTGPGVDFRNFFYSEMDSFGGQDLGQPNSWNGDRRWGNGGELMTARWTFPSLDAGTYKVYASWKSEPQENLGAARYTLGEDGPTVDINQTVGTAAIGSVTLNDGERLVTFAEVGEVTFGGGDFVVTVDDSITGSDQGDGGFIFADAIAITATASEALQITNVTVSSAGTEAVVTWLSSQGKNYDLEFSHDLEDWSRVAAGVSSQGSETSLTVDLAVLGLPETGFFRITPAAAP